MTMKFGLSKNTQTLKVNCQLMTYKSLDRWKSRMGNVIVLFLQEHLGN